MFQGKHPWGNTKPFSVEPFGRRPFSRAPADSILHWDADIDAFSEQTGGVHRFNHAVLSPQYQRNADGSYVDVGAKPAVDVFGGQKWLRSCGAVTNMLTNSIFEGAVSGTPGTAPTGWTDSAPSIGSVEVSGGEISVTVSANRRYFYQSLAVLANTTYIVSAIVGVSGNTTLALLFAGAVRFPSGTTLEFTVDGEVRDGSFVLTPGKYNIAAKYTVSITAGNGNVRVGAGAEGSVTGTFSFRDVQMTATAYPQPYVPTTAAGPVTQPASNATTTNGMWFALPDGSPLWKALTGEPLTLATRVRMGVGSGVIANSETLSIIACIGSTSGLQYIIRNSSGVLSVVGAYDGVSSALLTEEFVAGSIIRRVTQINTAGTQFRVGYMIEGTHTTIQWGSWANFDGSFNPSTLYRLMLGYNNAYPMWFNKITAWKKQATDAEILEAMAA